MNWAIKIISKTLMTKILHISWGVTTKAFTAMHWQNSSIKNIKIHGLNSKYNFVFYLSDSNISQLSNISMYSINKTGIYVSGTNITEISTISISDMAKGIEMDRFSSIFNIHTSVFTRLGSLNTFNGGAIDISDSRVTINNSTFQENHAQNGGAISIRCTNYSFWNTQFYSVNFINNSAGIQGGAIFYKFRRPILSNWIFNTNIASYGTNVASYAVKIVEINSFNSSIIFENEPSGIKINSVLKLALIDFDNQTLPDYSNTIKFNSFTSSSSVSGFNSAKDFNGTATFDNLIFVWSPGARDILKITSSSISSIKSKCKI